MPGTDSQMPTLAMPRVIHRHVEVNGLRIFYREAKAHEGAPTLLLLHGFPSGSHQFRKGEALAQARALENGRFIGERFTAAY